MLPAYSGAGGGGEEHERAQHGLLACDDDISEPEEVSPWEVDVALVAPDGARWRLLEVGQSQMAVGATRATRAEL